MTSNVDNPIADSKCGLRCLRAEDAVPSECAAEVDTGSAYRGVAVCGCARALAAGGVMAPPLWRHRGACAPRTAAAARGLRHARRALRSARSGGVEEVTVGPLLV
eukprot:580664-Prorocentrum_minimum.AAC.1